MKRRKDAAAAAADSISTLEDNGLFRLSYALFPGVLVNDLYRCHKGEKLDELARSALGIGKEDVSYVEIPRLYYSDRECDRSKLLKYNIVDSLLCAALINVKDDFVSYKFFVTSSYASKVPHSEFFGMQNAPDIAHVLLRVQEDRHAPGREDQTVARESQTLRGTGLAAFRVRPTVLLLRGQGGGRKVRVGRDQDEDRGEAVFFRPGRPARGGHARGDRRTETTVRECSAKERQARVAVLHAHSLDAVRAVSDTQTQTASFDNEGLIGDFYKTARLGRYAAVNIAKGKWSKSGKSAIDDEMKLTRLLSELLRYLSGRRNVSSTHAVSQLVDDFASTR